MSFMFYEANKFNQDIGKWNTTKAKTMYAMFWKATDFNQDIGRWNTVDVTEMSVMFMEANKFNKDIGNWNTANLARMSSMFSGASTFNQDIGSWNTSSVYLFSNMFFNAIAFNQDISFWNTSNGYNMESMFLGATSFNQDIGSWNLSVSLYCEYMLNDCGMDCKNYSNTLIGWQQNNPNLKYVKLGAYGLRYGDSAIEARKLLTTTQGWKIIDGGLTECVTSVSDLNDVSPMTLYPNPTSDLLHVELPEILMGETISVTNMMGQNLESKIIDSPKMDFDVGYLPSGIYFLQVRASNGIYIQKFIKD